MEKKCCATCEYAEYGEIQGYVCVNGDSEYVADFVEADHSCVDYEPKEERQSEYFHL